MSPLTFAHATALNAEEQHIFEHALALAAAADARLVSVHARDVGDEDMTAPDAGRVLEGWGSDRQVTHETMFHSCCDDPIDTLLDALRRVAPDLIIAGTHQRSGAARLLAGSQCEAILRNVTQPTLVFPYGARPLVGDDGRLSLRKIVIPIGDEASAKTALTRAVWIADLVGTKELELELLHVGDAADIPEVTPPEHAGWTARVHNVQGDVVEAVAAAASDACLLVMATRGPDSLKDSLFGTHTERVLRNTHCPVLITPITP
jgi:nucleotide-binding universal stress UspA family protein